MDASDQLKLDEPLVDKVPQEEPSLEHGPGAAELADLVAQYYEDNELYCKTFFPKTCRQDSAEFHKEMDDALWAGRRKVAIKAFRDAAKTARLRMFITKRIAFGVSRTVLYISKSEGHSVATLQWLKALVEKDTKWAQFWGISKGDTWTNEQAEFKNNILGISITVMAVGIHGQIRGVNFDDYRPDLIVCDDIEDEKTVNTKEQIKKHSELLHGTVMRSLASPVDNPEAMIVIIQTPLDPDDAIETAFASAGPDPLSDWLCIEVSCFKEIDFCVDGDENDKLISSWPAKLPTSFLKGEKQSYIRLNKLSVWLREMEVMLVSSELSFFKAEWLQKHRSLPTGQWQTLVLFIDPASSDDPDADFQAVTLTGMMGHQAWLIAYNKSRGQDIDDSVTKFFQTWDLMLTMGKGQAVLKFGVEIVSYQRQLKRAIEKEMHRRRRYAYIEGVQDKRSKSDVINQAFTPVASMGLYNCLESHTDFISDFEKYPRVKKDDLIESAARGLDMLDLTGRSGQIATGGIQRAMAPTTIVHSAHRMIPRANLAHYRARG